MYSAFQLLGVVATWLFFIGMSALAGIYVIPYLNPVTIEIGLYVLSCVLMNTDLIFEYSSVLLQLLGCLGFAGSLGFTMSHFKDGGDPKNAVRVIGLICTVVWGYTALRIQSHTIGLFTVGSLFSVMGFTVQILPFCYVIGFNTEDALVRCMNASFYLTCVYVWTLVSPQVKNVLAPFREGILIFGTIVYFIGALIISTKHYTTSHYLFNNLLAFGSAVVALLLGSTYRDLHPLLGVGGTFLVLLVLGKFTEIPWKEAGWAWGVTFFSGALYGTSLWFEKHPDWLISFSVV